MNDHDPIVIRAPKGLFDRDDLTLVPIDHLSSNPNTEFPNEGGIRSRFGSELALDFLNVNRFYMYKRIGEVDRYLILDTTGKLFDSANSLVVPILDIPAMTDFSIAVMYNRAYISPHNGQKGLPGEKVYVYEGSGTARAAGGATPSGFTIVATQGAAGKIEKGKRLFAVVYETASGHLTSYGPKPFVQYEDTAGAHKVNLSAIGVGPAEVTFKHIVMTKAADIDWDGNSDALEFFFVPNGKITNATTIFEVDLFDSELQDSADYLADILVDIPAAAGLVAYGERLVTWGEDANDSIIRASEPEEPENFHSVDGKRVVRPGTGGRITCCVPEVRGQMFIHKDKNTFVTQDTGGPPSGWAVDPVGKGKGTPSIWGAGKVLDEDGSTADYYFIADRTGLYPFNGAWDELPLTYKINKVWKRINKIHFHKVQVFDDPIKQRVYVSVPLDAATEPGHILMGDYQLGISADTIRWSIWNFPIAVKSIYVDVKYDTKETLLRGAAADSRIYQYREGLLNDFGNAILADTGTALIGENSESVINHYAAIRVRVVGSGTLEVRLYGMDLTANLQTPSIILETAPGTEKTQTFLFEASRALVDLRIASINDWFYWNKITLYANALWNDLPR